MGSLTTDALQLVFSYLPAEDVSTLWRVSDRLDWKQPLKLQNKLTKLLTERLIELQTSSCKVVKFYGFIHPGDKFELCEEPNSKIGGDRPDWSTEISLDINSESHRTSITQITVDWKNTPRITPMFALCVLQAHRVAFEAIVAPTPVGKEVMNETALLFSKLSISKT